MDNDTKKYLLKDYYGEDYNLVPIMTRYTNNGRLAILLYDEEEMYFCDLTVNLPNSQLSDTKRNDLAFVNVNDNPWLTSFIEKHQLGRPTNHSGRSGYCSYPEYVFDLTMLNEER